MATYLSLDALARAVRKEGVIAVPMGQIRDAYGAERLGSNVRRGIGSSLTRRGLAHIPRTLPGYQEDIVVIYKNYGPVHELITDATKAGARQMSTFIPLIINLAAQERVKLNAIRDLLREEGAEA